MVQEGTKVTLTPTGTPGATATFIVRFPALVGPRQVRDLVHHQRLSPVRAYRNDRTTGGR
jgi:hypothetical protein